MTQLTLDVEFLTKLLYEAFEQGVNFEGSASNVPAQDYVQRAIRNMTSIPDGAYNKTVLEHANDIMNKRSEEKSRKYGPFKSSMEHTAAIASAMQRKSITAEDVNVVLIALKLSRITYAFNVDNYIDACAYIQGLHDLNLGYESK